MGKRCDLIVAYMSENSSMAMNQAVEIIFIYEEYPEFVVF